MNGLKILKNKGIIFGLPRIDSTNLCEGCIYSKQTRKSFHVGRSRRASHCLELIHADLCGPMQTNSLGGSIYFLLFIDDYSRMSWVYFLQHKSETFQKFQMFKAMVENQSGCHIKVLRTDRGGEFVSKDFNLFCEEEGIQRELTAPYTPEQNGIAERKNRTIVEMARSMLQARRLPNQFWAEAVATSVYLLNISPTKAVMNRTPYEAWHRRKPSVSHLRIFGCVAYALKHPQTRQKLDEKSEKCIFIGYCTQSKAYKLYNPVSEKILVRRDVIFNENVSWDWSKEQEQQKITVEVSPNEETRVNSSASTATQSVSNSSSSPSLNSNSSLEELSDETPPRKYKFLADIYASCQFALTISDPMNYEEATEKEDGKKAMTVEMQSVKKDGTWDMVDLPNEKFYGDLQEEVYVTPPEGFIKKTKKQRYTS